MSITGLKITIDFIILFLLIIFNYFWFIELRTIKTKLIDSLIILLELGLIFVGIYVWLV